MTAAIKYEPRVYTDEFLEKLAGLYNSSVRLPCGGRDVAGRLLRV